MQEPFPQNLQPLLNDLDVPSLRALLTSLYGLDPAVDARMVLGLKRSDHSEFAKLIKGRLSSIKRGKKFISYFEAAAFADNLQALADDISSFGEHNPKLAFELFSVFMDSHHQIMDRADDSKGNLGEVFRSGAETWIRLARTYRATPACMVDWLDLIEALHLDNHYGVWDYLICNSLGLLSQDELMALNERFEKHLAKFKQTQLKNTAVHQFSYEGMHIQSALSAVAKALKNVELYERAATCRSEEPNEMQTLDIAKFCLQAGNATRALYWLDSIERASRFMEDHDKLLDQALLATGHSERLVALRQKRYHTNPSKANLQSLAEILPAEQGEELRRHALAKVLAIDSLGDRITNLLEFDAIGLAAQEAVNHSPQLEELFYSTLLGWIKSFEAHSKNSGNGEGSYYEKQTVWLATVLCYRSLIKQILQAAKSKIYHHAVNYFKALQGLDAQAALQSSNYYSPHPNHLQFTDELRVRHGRKTAFWREV